MCFFFRKPVQLGLCFDLMHISRMPRKNPELGFSLLSFESQSPRLHAEDLSHLLQITYLIFNPRYQSIIDFCIPIIRPVYAVYIV
jgi:hypothetical protein